MFPVVSVALRPWKALFHAEGGGAEEKLGQTFPEELSSTAAAAARAAAVDRDSYWTVLPPEWVVG